LNFRVRAISLLVQQRLSAPTPVKCDVAVPGRKCVVEGGLDFRIMCVSSYCTTVLYKVCLIERPLRTHSSPVSQASAARRESFAGSNAAQRKTCVSSRYFTGKSFPRCP